MMCDILDYIILRDLVYRFHPMRYDVTKNSVASFKPRRFKVSNEKLAAVGSYQNWPWPICRLCQSAGLKSRP
jgi:hypothetical protein